MLGLEGSMQINRRDRNGVLMAGAPLKLENGLMLIGALSNLLLRSIETDEPEQQNAMVDYFQTKHFFVFSHEWQPIN